jgi:hypothetical protein
MMQFNIHHLLHACFYKLIIFIILLFINHFRKIESVVIKSVFHVSYKHAYLIHKIIILCEKYNNKYPCELLLTYIVRLLHKILQRVNNLEICKKTYHQSQSQANQALNPK